MKIKSGKLDRIPAQYSDELMSVITSMIQQDPNKRPSTDELLNHPQVSVRYKEKKIKEHYNKLKK